MILSARAYLVLASILGAVYCAFYDLWVAAAYLAASAGLLAPVYAFVRVRNRDSYLLLFSAVVIWGSYFIRPVLLTARPDAFKYPLLGQLDHSVIAEALLEAGVFSLLFLLGQHIGQSGFKGRAARPADDGFLLRGRLAINAMIVTFVGLSAWLQYFAAVGVRGAEAGAYNFVLRLLPLSLVYAVCILFLMRYGKVLGGRQRRFYIYVMAFLSAMSFLAGSKAFLVFMLLPVVLYYLRSTVIPRFELARALLVAIIGVAVLAASFTVPRFVRYAVLAQGYESGFMRIAMVSMRESFQRDFRGDWAAASYSIADRVTQRLNGIDGLIATDILQPPILQEIFNWRETTTRVVGRLLPGARLRGTSSGKAVGLYYGGKDLQQRHAGAVGLFGAAKLTAGAAAPVFVLLFGAACGGLIRLVRRQRDSDARFLFQYLVATSLLFPLIMSGNLDVVLSGFVAGMVQLVFYGLVLLVVLRAVTPFARRRTGNGRLPAPGSGTSADEPVSDDG